LGEQVASLDWLPIFDLGASRRGHGVLALLALLGGDGHLIAADVGRTREARDDRRLVLVVGYRDRLPDFDPLALLDVRTVAGGQFVLVAVGLPRDDLDQAGVFGTLELDDPVQLGQDGLALWHASLEQLLNARQTRGDVDTRDTTSVEGAHG